MANSETENAESYQPQQRRRSFLQRKWSAQDINKAALILVAHLLCILAPSTFSWAAFWVALGIVFPTGLLGINLGYHRCLTHRSLKLPQWLEYFCAYCGVQALQGDPIDWVSAHRFHHQFVDTERDPHSPLEGFWHSYLLWFFDSEAIVLKAGEPNNVGDLDKQPFYKFMQRTYPLHPIALALLLYSIGGMPFIVWGMGVRSTVTLHAGALVNYVCHTWGEQPWNTGDLSRNNWFLGLYAFGEGWHNNHHAFKFSARHGLEWWQIDATWKWSAQDINKAALILVAHLLCILAPSTFSWAAFWVALGIVFPTGLLGINLGYHRCLTHRSLKLPQWLEYFCAYCGVQALQGDPIDWVSAHRFHHQFVDTERDPHSPLEGFWHSYLLWFFDSEAIVLKAGEPNNVGDLDKQPFYKFMQRTYPLHPISLAVLLYAIGGMPFIVWGMGVRGTVTLHAGALVNYVCHTWGEQPWNTGDLSRNNWFLGLYAFGEGWHNNHHAFKFSARHGLEWWQIDATWYVIKFLETVGLATDVKLPTDSQKQKMALNGGSSHKNKII